jgi:hypothetical protein
MSSPAPKRTCGQTSLAAVCDLEPGRAQKLLPAPLTAIAERAFIYLVWCSLYSDTSTVRERSFLEANIAIPCDGPAGEGTWFAGSYFNSRQIVRHGHLSGWTSDHAHIEIGRVPAGVGRLVWPSRTPVGGWVARGGRREIEMVVRPGEPVDLDTTPLHKFLRVYGVRRFGDHTDVTLERHIEDVILRIREADADLTLAGDAAALLGPVSVSAGYLMEFGIDLGGSELVSGR